MIFPFFVPPHRYPPTFVLDVSVAETWAIPRNYSLYTNRVQFKLISTVALVPATWPFDLAEQMRVALNQGETTQHRIDVLINSISLLHIYVDDEGPFRACHDLLKLARTHNIPVSNSAYLELALRMNLPLATIDPALTRAANAAGVSIFTP